MFASKTIAVKAMPTAAYKNEQLNLFQEFLANEVDTDTLSNAILLWDNTPRYSVSRKQMDSKRNSDGSLPVLKREFKHLNRNYAVEIRPARIEVRKNGKLTGENLDFYPSGREELVEQALRKLATEQASGFYDQSCHSTGVTFTLYQLRGELAKRGHSFKHHDLIESLDILNLSNIRLLEANSSNTDSSMASQAYFPLLIKITKAIHNSEPDAKWHVQFHRLVADSIKNLTYRQFNYARWMSCKLHLSRWLITYLVLKFTQAAPLAKFTMRYSTIERDSGMLNFTQPRQAIAALDEAFSEIKSTGIVVNFDKKISRGIRGKIIDVEYILQPSIKFVREQKASNKRNLNSESSCRQNPEQKIMNCKT